MLSNRQTITLQAQYNLNCSDGEPNMRFLFQSAVVGQAMLHRRCGKCMLLIFLTYSTPFDILSFVNIKFIVFYL